MRGSAASTMLDERLAQHLDGAGDHRSPNRSSERRRRRARSASDRWSSGAFIATRNTSRRRATSCSPSTRRIAAGVRPPSATASERPAGVAVGERLDDVVDRRLRRSATPPAATTWSSADSVSRAEPRARAHGVVDGVGGNVEPGLVDDVPDVLLELVRGQQVELEVLGAAADRLARPSADRWWRARTRRAGGGSSSVFSSASDGRVRQHVDLVEDVHLRAAGRAERGPLDEVADGVDPVVRRRVELVDVEARAVLDRHGTTRTRRTARRRPAFAQFSTLARMRAVDVLPVPRGPLNR